MADQRIRYNKKGIYASEPQNNPEAFFYPSQETLYGNGVPDDSIGRQNDYYVDMDTSNLYQKTFKIDVF